ncbi:uncharacterized protein LOC129786237 [Lutzomyia longipalpis]|uniref:uncharacterized protein LOC129786237 n=1 Tax=Lutzomyia longipalpis TaxID=7200 RepID=UPI0024839FE6|nr:uncharacterized protein LOC129786237 [Lutzomyia longipalpis]
MKVLAVFIALVVATAQAQFSQEIEEFHRMFDEYHEEVDYWLRDQRLLVSDSIRQANRVALEQVWNDVTAVRLITVSAEQAIDNHAAEVGENPCIAQIRTRLADLEEEAGVSISSCSRNLHRDFQHALDYGFFIHINYAQRMSHFLQLLVLYTLGHYNAVTNQDYIRYELQENWDHRENIRDEYYINYYRDMLEVGKTTGNINMENCLLIVANLYNIDVNQLRDDLSHC